MYALHRKHVSEFKEIQSKLSYMPAGEVYELYCSYARMEADAMTDMLGEEVAVKYMLSPVLGSGSIGNDELIECEAIAAKLRRSMQPLSFVALMDYLASESNKAVLDGDEAGLARAGKQMEKYGSPRTYLKAEYLGKDIQNLENGIASATESQDYERAAALQEELRRTKNRE